MVENAAKSPGNVLLRLDVDKANRFSNDLLSNKSAPVTSAAPVDLEPTEQPTTADPEQKTNMFNVSQIDHHQSHTNLSHKSHPDHANTLQQHRPPMYKSHGNLHHHHEFGLGRPEPSLLSAPIIPLDSILLYSTSLTSINYCAETYAKSSEAYSHSRRASSSTNNRDGAQLPLYFDSSHHPSHHHHHHHQHHGRSRRQSLTSTAHVPSLVSNGLVSSPSLSLKTDTPASLSHSTSIKSNHAPAQNTCRTLRALLSFNLLYEPLFVWFALSNFLTSLGKASSISPYHSKRQTFF